MTPASGCQGGRQLRPLRVQLDVHRGVEREPVAVPLAGEEGLEVREVRGREARDVVLRGRRAVGVQREEAHPQGLVPALRGAPVEQLLSRDGREHEQEQGDAQVFPHVRRRRARGARPGCLQGCRRVADQGPAP